MNNFKTNYDGGLPLVLDDFRWMHSITTEAFKSVLSSFGITDQQTFIFSGCQRSVAGGIVTITEGYVSIGGEPCHVLEHSYPEPTGGDVEFWVIDTSYDASGAKVFQNTTLNETYEIRKGKISVGASVPPGNTSYSNTNTIHELIHSNLPLDTWHQLTTQTISPPVLLDGSYAVEYRKDLSGFIHFSGQYHTGEDPGSGIVDVLIATLPAGYRPAVNKLYPISTINASSAGSNMIQIGSNGEVRIKVLDADYVNLFDFSQITPFEAV